MFTRENPLPAPSPTDLPPRALLRAWGVTRVGRVTGLDRMGRAGIEVACAIRPRGHVLQVCNGKGWTFRRAARAALSEAAELEACETPDPVDLRWASASQMRRRLGDRAVWNLVPGLDDGCVVAWAEGRSLVTGHPVWLPAAAIYCPPPGGLGLAPFPVHWTSNGLAAHPSRAKALTHALFELAERDSLSRVLPNGWTAGTVRTAALPAGQAGRLSPRAGHTLARLAENGLEARLFVWPRGAPGGLPWPLAAALLFDEEGSPIPLTAGYACSASARDAVEGALLEAAQSRLTDIHGAREDVRPMDQEGVSRLRRWCRAAGAGRMGSRLRSSAVPSLTPLIRAFVRAGHSDLAAVDLASGRAGLHVVRVLSPSLALTELL